MIDKTTIHMPDGTRIAQPDMAARLAGYWATAVTATKTVVVILAVIGGHTITAPLRGPRSRSLLLHGSYRQFLDVARKAVR